MIVIVMQVVMRVIGVIESWREGKEGRKEIVDDGLGDGMTASLSFFAFLRVCLLVS